MKLPEKKKGSTLAGPDHPVPQIIMERVSFLLNRSAQRIREISDEALKPYQMTGRHVGVLTTIHEKGSVPQNEIGHCMHIDRTTMVDVVDDLENKGLVERKENPVDRRAYALALTAKGKEILPKVQKLGFDAERQYLSHLQPKEQKDIIQILQKLVRAHFLQAKS
jgi:MarR family transcriptional regulator, lower aerobic nicotinate degradation pathway regulator